MNDLVEIQTKRHPLKQERSTFNLPAGMSIDEMLNTVKMGPTLRRQCHVFVDGNKVPHDRWSMTIPTAGQKVFVSVLPTGGGDGGKGILRIVLTIVIIAAAVATGNLAAASLGFQTGTTAFAVTSAVVAAGVTTVGNLLINALIPPSRPNIGLNQSFVADSPTLDISAARNTVNRFGVIPRILGKHKIVPPYGAKPFTELVGNDQFLRLLFVIGYGPVVMTDLRIGDIPVGEFDDVQVEIREGVAGVVTTTTLYTNAVDEQAFGGLQLKQGVPAIRATIADTDEFSVEVQFPSLLRISPSGEKQPLTVDIKVEYRLQPAVPFVDAGTISVTAATTAAVRQGFRVANLAPGTYDIQLTKLTADLESDPQAQDATFWAKLRSVKNVAPISFPGLALVEMRIKATDQLNGIVDQFSLIASGKYINWDSGGAEWGGVGEEEETSNPAALYRTVLQDSANAQALPDSRLDLPSIQAFHDFCEANDFEFNANLDFSSTVEETLKEVCKAGRGSPSQVDGKYGVLIDQAQTTIAQYFTPNNSRGFKSTKTFIEQPHAYRTSFINENEGYISDEQIVFNDGFNSGNATRFEALKFFGVTDPDQVFELARYFQKVSALRPENYSFFTDIENLVCTRGSLIRVNHDVTKFGRGFGRIKAIIESAPPGDIDQIVLDSEVTFDTSGTHVLRVRRLDGTELVGTPFTITDTPAGQSTNVLTIPAGTSISEGSALIGGLAMFGIVDLESVELVVAGIKPKGDLEAEILCFDYDEEIFETDVAPPFTSNITPDPQIPIPIIESVTVKETALLIDSAGIQFVDLDVNIIIPPGGNNGFIINVLEVQVRIVGSTDPFASFIANGDASLVTIARLPIGTALEIKVRYKTPTADGGFSAITNFTIPGLNPVDVVQTVSGLQLFGKAHETIFEGNDIKVTWRHSGFHEFVGGEFGADGSTPPWFRDYFVRIYNGDGLGVNAAVIREESVTDTFYTYTQEKNFEDHSDSAKRQMTIGVVQRGNEGQESAEESRITVNNPTPAALAGIVVSGSPETIFIKYIIPIDNDLAGVIAHFSTSQGFTPSDSNIGFIGDFGTAILSDLETGVEYFIRIGAFDKFGTDGIILSSEFSFTTPNVNIAPDSITETEIADDSISTPKLQANAITGDKVDANTIVAGNIAAGAITSDELDTDAVIASKIAAGSITADKYAELRQTLPYNGGDSLDLTHPFEIPFNIPSETTDIVAVKLSFQILPYRAYSTIVSNISQTSPTTTSDPETSPTSTEDLGETHNHTYALTDSGSGNTASFSPTTREIYSTSSGQFTITTEDGHNHTVTVHGGSLPTGSKTLVISGGTLGSASAGLVDTSEVNGHIHQLIIADNGGTGAGVFSSSGSLRASGGGNVDSTESPAKHTHDVIIAAHDHQVTIAGHTHAITFGITEQAPSSASVGLKVDDGSGFGSELGLFAANQVEFDITSEFAGSLGIKRLKFTANENMRIDYQLEIKIDITA